MTARNGSTTYTVGANLGTYLGSMYVAGTAGQVTCHNTYRQSSKWGVWNAYNRIPITLKAGDTTAGWTIGGGGSAAFRALNGSTANSFTIFSGLPEQNYELSSYLRGSFVASTNGILQFYTGIGFSSTTSASGIVGTHGVSFGAGVIGNFTFTHSAAGRYSFPSGLIGIAVVTHLEAYTANTTAPTVVAGGEASNLLMGTWLG